VDDEWRSRRVCSPPASRSTPTSGGGQASAEAAGGAEPTDGPEDDDSVLSPSGVADVSPAVFALFGLAALGLLVGLVGGLRALHGRLKDG
jgi:hypothetical protein